MYNINVMAEKTGLPIRKLLKNTLINSIVGQTKIKKTSTHLIENQTQCHCTLTPSNRIPSPK
jgi:hypothetical protein